MGKVKDLMIEEERKWDLLNENLEDLGVVDDETHGKMLERYIEEKGLTNADDFDVEDWNKWLERKLVYDMRNPEQRENEPENTKIISLQEVIEMTEEEAEENGVGHIKKMWHNELEEEYRERQQEREREEKEKDENERREIWRVINQYVAEADGFERDGKIDIRKLNKWCQEKSIPLPQAIKNHYNIQ